MKRLGKRFAVLLVLALIGLAGAGCAQSGIVPGLNPGPVPPTEWIDAMALRTEIDNRITNQYAIIAVERVEQRGGYNSVSVERINNAAAELVLDPHWGPLTACEAFIVALRRADPDAAVGLALVGPPESSRYWVVVADVVQNYFVLRLVDPLGWRIVDWNSCQPAGFVAM